MNLIEILLFASRVVAIYGITAPILDAIVYYIGHFFGNAKIKQHGIKNLMVKDWQISAPITLFAVGIFIIDGVYLLAGAVVFIFATRCLFTYFMKRT